MTSWPGSSIDRLFAHGTAPVRIWDLMFIELIGPGAVGKSTVAPLLAKRLGVPHYAGQGFYRLDGTPMTGWQIWGDRIISTITDPGLTVATLRAQGGPLPDRLSFALTTTRRERFVRKALRTDGGVFSSGPVHWLCQESTRYETDLTDLLPRVVHSDVYVRLSADPDTITRRLEARGGKSESRIVEHPQWVERYEMYADRALDAIDRPVIEVAANGAPNAVAEEIMKRLQLAAQQGQS